MAVFAGSSEGLVTTGNISQLLLRDLNTVRGARQLYPNEHDRVFKPKRATMNPMTNMEMDDMAWGDRTDQGVAAPVSSTGQGISTTYPIYAYTNSLYVTLDAFTDSQYQDQWTPQSEGFINSQDVLRNMVLWGFFNDASNQGSQLGDGKPLFSTEHALSTGTFANTFPTPVALSKDSLEYATNAISLYTSYSLYPMQLRSTSLEVSVPLSQQAQTLLFSSKSPTTANHAINALNYGGYYSEGVFANPYILDPTFFLGRSNEEDTFVHWEYMDFTVESLPLQSNWTMGFASIERFGYGCGSARACFGSTQYI